MGFVLGRTAIKSNTSSNKKFVLGAKPNISIKKDAVKQKHDVQEKRLNEGNKPDVSYAQYDNLKSALVPIDSNMAARRNNIKPEVKKPTASKEALKSNITQFAAGVSESSIPKAVSSMQKISSGKDSLTDRLRTESQPYSNAARVAGSVAGELAGSAVTYGTVGKAIGATSAMQKIASPFLRNMVAGQLADTAIQTPTVIMEGVANKRSAGEIAANVGKQQAMDLAGNILFGGVDVGLSKLKSALKKPVQEIADSTETIPLQKVKPSTAQGKYKAKNAAFENVVKEYNDAIEQVQNHFKTNELRTNEVAKIKSELGIDLDDIISRMEQAEKSIQLPNADSVRLRRAAGAASDKAYGIGEKAATLTQPKASSIAQPIAAKTDIRQVSTPSPNKVAQNGVQEVPGQFKGAEPGDINYKPVKVGAQVQIVKGKTQQTSKFEFSDPELERVHKQNKGVAEETTIQKVKGRIVDAVNMFKRPIGTLSYTKENAELYKDLTKLPKLRSMASDDTVRTLDDITKDMDKNGFDMFERKVLLDDLAEEAKLGSKLPNKWTTETIQAELARLDEAMPQGVRDGIKKRKQYWSVLKDDYITALKDVGVDMSDALTRENYFRHQVLDYIEAKNSIIGTGKKLKTPANRGFTKGRTGEYEGNINTDYLQAEFEVMAQMKHDVEITKTIKNVDINYNIAGKVKADAKAQGLENWKDAIPEGYTTWQPREGNVFYMSKPLGAEIVEQSLAMRGIKLNSIKDPKLKVALEDIMNDLADQTGALVMGGKRKEFVVKQEIADTLNNLTKVQTTNALSRISKSVMNAWKSWILVLNPKSVVKYNVRNFSGDLDAIIAGNPGTIKKVPRASKELYDALINGKFTPELKSWYDRGGYQSLLYAQEISQVNKLKPFEKFRDISLSEKITKPLRKYAEFTKSVTNYREATGRYAAYLDYLDQLKSGKLKNYGASRPEIVDGIKGMEDKAFKLSNDLLGAYDEVSQAGQVIRNHIIPFYSWMEINMKRYKNLFKNAVTNKEVGKTAALSASLVAKLGVKTATKLTGIFAMTAALSAWNQLKYADLEDTLPEDVRSRPHVILGQDKNGNTLYFSRLGSLNDFLGWFGLDNAQQDVRDIMNGKQTVEEFMVNAIKSPANKIIGAVTPAAKLPFEVLSGQKLYPDAFKPSTIRDKKQYIAQSMGVRSEYDVVSGKPHRPYFENLNDALMYKADPAEQAYYSVLNLKGKYKEDKLGIKRTGGMYSTKKSDALYNWKLAIKYKDDKARKKYLAEYFKLGGTDKGLNQSIKALNPLSGLSTDQQAQFFAGLTAKEKEKLKQAMKYYNELLNPNK